MINIHNNTIIDNSSEREIKSLFFQKNEIANKNDGDATRALDCAKECDFVFEESDKFFDNSNDLTMLNVIKEIISHQSITNFDIATGYWDIPGVTLLEKSLREFFARGGVLRLLIGKDPYFMIRCNIKAEVSPKDYIKKKLDELTPKPEYKGAVELLKKYCDTPQLQIKLYKGCGEWQFLHAKCYILYGKGDETYGIIGSSNFTEKGLRDNAELNYLETDPVRVTAEPKPHSGARGHIFWFNQKWKLGEEWGKTFLEEVLKPSSVGKAFPPEKIDTPLTAAECYIRTLQDKFGVITDAKFKEVLEGYLPPSIKAYDYQINAVQQCFSYLLQHEGFILGDVVGLGKTIVAVLLVRYFMDVAGSLGRDANILIITPPAILSAWRETVKKFDKGKADKLQSRVDFLTLGSLGKLEGEADGAGSADSTDSADDAGNANSAIEESTSSEEVDDIKAGEEEGLEDDETDSEDGAKLAALKSNGKNYGLVIIDESHRFRNKNTQKYEALTSYFEAVHARAGWYPFVGLLSATIQNNYPRDIQNQIYLFEHEPKHSTFEKIKGRDLERFFAIINNEFEEVKSNNSTLTPQKRREKTIELSKRVRECVLSDVLVRRTRTDIIKHYKSSFTFPKIHSPISLEYTMDEELSKLFFDTMNIIAPEDEIGGLGYYRYRATMFLCEDYKKRYSGRNMSAERSSTQLAKLMQTLLVKRLESSFSAFKQSLKNLKRYTQNMIDMWNNESIYICPQLDVNAELNIEAKKARRPNETITIETCYADIETKIEKLNKSDRNKKGQNAKYKPTDFVALTEGGKTYIELLQEDLQKIESLEKRWDENDYDPKLDKFKEVLKSADGFLSKEKNAAQKLVIFSEAIPTTQSLERAVENIMGKKPLVVTSKNRKNLEETIKSNFDANYPTEKQSNDYSVIITTEVLAEGINLHRANSILNYDTPWNATRLIQRIGRVNRIGTENSDIYVYNFYPSAQGDEEINLVRKAYTKLQSFHTMFGEDSKIFSEEEELSEANFEHSTNGEESPQEKYIALLKDYKNKNSERYEFLEKLPSVKSKAIAATDPKIAGNAYFAIKVEGKTGCVYVKTNKEATPTVISALEMFESCKCDQNTKELPLPKNAKELENIALNAYKEYCTKPSKPKNLSKSVTQTLSKAKKLIDKKTLTKESQTLVTQAVSSIKNGNIPLAKRLTSLLTRMEKAEEDLIPVQSEEVVAMIKTELGSFAAKTDAKNGKAYTFAAFYLTQG